MSIYRLLEQSDALSEGLYSWVYAMSHMRGIENSEYQRREELSKRIIKVWQNQSEKLILSKEEGKAQITELPEVLEEFTFLRGIDASYNDLTFLPSLEKLPKLELLRLVGNRLPLGAILPLTQLSKKCDIHVHYNPTLSREDFAEISRAVKEVQKANPKKGPTFYPLTV